MNNAKIIPMPPPGKKLSKFEKERLKAYDFYFNKWRGNESVTPAFGQKVRITRSGWDHIINPPRKRTKAEQIERFKVLPLARKLLEEAQTFQEHRKDRSGHYFAFAGYLSGKKIKVVVRSKIFRGQKYFYSVMIVL